MNTKDIVSLINDTRRIYRGLEELSEYLNNLTSEHMQQIVNGEILMNDSSKNTLQQLI